jgi:hypothetical protein
MAIDVDNLVDNFVFNLAAIFDDNWQRLGIKELYKDDVWMVPLTPSLALSCAAMWNDLRSLSSVNVRYQYNFVGEVWYYHGAMNPDVTKNLVMRHAYAIVEHIIKNASLNGFLTNTRALVRSCAYTPRLRSGTMLSTARITVVAPYQTRVALVR